MVKLCSYRRGGAVCRGNVPKVRWLTVGNRIAAGQAAALGLKNTFARLVSRLELLRLKPSDGCSQTPGPQGDIGLELQSVV
jgi:hypothetical protein